MVLFNLDCSGSMAGSKWNRVVQAVENFTSHLGQNDLVCGIVFNNTIRAITSPLD